MNHTHETPRVLIADDEPAVRYMLRAVLEEEGLEVVEVDNGVAALEAVEKDHTLSLILSDLKMPGLTGLELLAALQGKPHAPPLILITAHGSERVAVEAMKLGAVDYFRKPIDADEIATVVRRHLGLIRLRKENNRLRAKLSLGSMVFESAAMQRVAEMVDRVAGRDVTVLIVGETGTGKELVARALVAGSPRSKRAMCDSTAPRSRVNWSRRSFLAIAGAPLPVPCVSARGSFARLTRAPFSWTR